MSPKRPTAMVLAVNPDRRRGLDIPEVTDRDHRRLPASRSASSHLVPPSCVRSDLELPAHDRDGLLCRASGKARHRRRFRPDAVDCRRLPRSHRGARIQFSTSPAVEPATQHDRPPSSRFACLRRAPARRSSGLLEGDRRLHEAGRQRRCSGGRSAKACPCTVTCTTSWDRSMRFAPTWMPGVAKPAAFADPKPVDPGGPHDPAVAATAWRWLWPLAAGRSRSRPRRSASWRLQSPAPTIPRQSLWRTPGSCSSPTSTASSRRPRCRATGGSSAFLSDRDGRMDVWVTQVGTGQFLQPDARTPRASSSTRRSARSASRLTERSSRSGRAGPPAPVNADISIWAVPRARRQPRPYLEGVAEFDWSSDGARLVYHTPGPGDPMFVRDAGQADGGAADLLGAGGTAQSLSRSGRRIGRSSISSRDRCPIAWTSGASGRPAEPPSGSRITIRSSATRYS